jgi:hypothetical protein
MAETLTSDLPPSKVRDEIIREAKRLEERTRDSSKGHHCAAEGWNKRGLQLGIPTLITSAVTSAAVFTQAAKELWWLGIAAGILSVVVTVLTTLSTFLSPNEKENAHLTAANAYDRLNNDARMFWAIECWSTTSSEEALTAKLTELVERKNKLNSDSPQIPPWAWNLAQERINKGEATYEVDKVAKPALPALARLNSYQPRRLLLLVLTGGRWFGKSWKSNYRSAALITLSSSRLRSST